MAHLTPRFGPEVWAAGAVSDKNCDFAEGERERGVALYKWVDAAGGQVQHFLMASTDDVTVGVALVRRAL